VTQLNCTSKQKTKNLFLQSTGRESTNTTHSKKAPKTINKIDELIIMTFSRIITIKIVKINGVKSKSTPRPIIPLKLSSGYLSELLFDTGAAITCMAIKELRKIPNNVELNQIKDSGKICQGASRANLIPVGTYLMPLEWQGKKSFTL
jgi:hypothetical protein